MHCKTFTTTLRRQLSDVCQHKCHFVQRFSSNSLPWVSSFCFSTECRQSANLSVSSRVFSSSPVAKRCDDAASPRIYTTNSSATSTAIFSSHLNEPNINNHTNGHSVPDKKEIQHDIDFCYEILNQVSRSFAMVIQQLPEDMRHSVCVFYLVLRALDTIEDEMCDHDSYQKQSLLARFHKILDCKDSKRKQFEFFEWAPWCQQSTFDKALHKLVHVHMGHMGNMHGSRSTTSYNIQNAQHADTCTSRNGANGVHAYHGVTGTNNGLNGTANGSHRIAAKLDAKHESNKQLLQQFDSVLNVFHYVLNSRERNVIQSITKEMGYGMSQFTRKLSIASMDPEDGNNKCKVDSFAELDDYCYYVAGCVGLGLSQLFSVSKHVHASFAKDQIQNSIEMGLFLQKTNITRDFLEDFKEGRVFWPRELFVKYDVDLPYIFNNNDDGSFAMDDTVQSNLLRFMETAKNAIVGDESGHSGQNAAKAANGANGATDNTDTWQHGLVHASSPKSTGATENKADALNRSDRSEAQLLCCLNDMVYETLSHLQATMDYLSTLDACNNSKIFQFCAIPQIMALATIEKCFNNKQVYQTEVKISKVLTLQIIAKSSNMADVKYWYGYFLNKMHDRIASNQDDTHRNEDFARLIQQIRQQL